MTGATRFCLDVRFGVVGALGLAVESTGRAGALFLPLRGEGCCLEVCSTLGTLGPIPISFRKRLMETISRKWIVQREQEGQRNGVVAHEARHGGESLKAQRKTRVIDSNSVVGACVFLNRKNHTKSHVRETYGDVMQVMGMGLGKTRCVCRLPGP